MGASRRRFRPVVDDSLETRVVLSRAAALPEAVAILHGTQLHPEIALKAPNHSSTPTYSWGNQPRRFIVKTRATKSSLAQLLGTEAPNGHVYTYQFRYRNNTSKSYPWGAMTIKLDPGLRYLPGTITQPTGTDVANPITKVVTSIDPNRVQTLSVVFGHGFTTKTMGTFTFQVKFHPPQS